MAFAADTFYGFDLGVKNGAVARLTPISPTETPALSFMAWPMKSLAEALLSDAEGIIRVHSHFIQEWLTITPVDQSIRCFGDWTVNEVNWGRTLRMPAALKAYLAGLYTGALSPQVIITWVPPNLVRRALGLHPNTPKEGVWKGMERACGEWGTLLFEETDNEHERDALTLSLLAALDGMAPKLPPLAYPVKQISSVRKE